MEKVEVPLPIRRVSVPLGARAEGCKLLCMFPVQWDEVTCWDAKKSVNRPAHLVEDAWT